jgi:cysteine desulfurase
MKPIYLDHHATTPMDPRVLEAMLPFFTEKFGNAASKTHLYGREANEAVEESRARIATLLHADPREIIFTSGATESDNLAVKGVAESYSERGRHLITAQTEHRAVLDSCRFLEEKGFQVTYLPVDSAGLVDPKEVQKAITDKTLLVSLMFANHEIGTMQDIAAISRIAKERGVFFHCDATQGVGKEPIDVETLGLDLLSLSGHKIHGPKGVGALYVRRKNPRVRLAPIFHGGGHERTLRSGTLNVPAIVGLGKACEIARAEMDTERERLRYLRDRLQACIQANLEGVRQNGHPAQRLAGNLNLSFSGIEGTKLLSSLSSDLAVSSGAACTSAVPEPSYVLKAIGVPLDLMLATLRIGVGRFTTEDEIQRAGDKIVKAVKGLRSKRVLSHAEPPQCAAPSKGPFRPD